MLVDIKYHIVTIIALFITLGIGILIGSMVGSDTIIEQQQGLINDLKSDFKILRQENKKFKAQINKLEGRLASNLKFEKKMLSLIIGKKLKGERLLISSGANVKSEVEEKIINFLELADPKLIKLSKKDKLKIVDLKKDNYTKILIIGAENNNLKKEFLNLEAKVVEVPVNSLDSVPKIIEFILGLTTENLEVKKGEKLR